MKTLNFEKTNEIFAEFELSFEEMIYVRGGQHEGTALPPVPPIKI